MLNILYIGPNDSEWAQMNRPVGLASAKWARGFLSALSKHANVIALSHSYNYPWPKGPRLWGEVDTRLFNQDWESVAIGYPVLRHIREWYLSSAYPRAARKIFGSRQIDAVLFYNCEYPHERKCINAIAKLGVPCFPIILDGDDPRKDDWGWLKEGTKAAAGVVMLSWWVYKNWPNNLPKYHFDGGAEGWRGIKDEGSVATEAMADKWGMRNEKVLVHTGALDQWRGLDFMAKVVDIITRKRDDVKFVFCGKSSEKAIRLKFGGNSKVELRGFVSETEMGEICNSADVLLNVRDPNHPDNILNYPSKLPHYLSFGRPVVSTPLESLSPDYADVVIFPLEATPEAYVEKIEQVLTWDAARREREYEKIKEWFERRKSWDVMAGNLARWLEETVKK